MDRPALKQLLADVAEGEVDVIVLYKVDRLTRSLADFARIVEVLDEAGASFVSITQSFNTTTSMGRLTLNVLLSFAQFEREVTGERIRDKIAASKAKGMWMGGIVPLGYQVKERKLVIVEAEADIVRMIFERYSELQSMVALADELHARGIRSKQRTLSDGRSYGGQPMNRGALAHLLKNRVYIGEVTHRDQAYPGEHLPIIDRDLWEKVQALIAGNTHERRTSSRGTEPSLLIGMISDGFGRPMTPTHASRGTRRYRYYVSRTEEDDPHRLWRLPAHSIEQLVLDRMVKLIGEGRALSGKLSAPSTEISELIRQRSKELAQRMASSGAVVAHSLLSELAFRLQVHDDRAELQLGTGELLTMILGKDSRWIAVEVRDQSPIQMVVPVRIRRRGQELKLVFSGRDSEAPAQVDQNLIELVVKAHQARERLFSEGREIAKAERPHLTRLARISYLAPDIQTAIMEGRQPANLSARQLLRTADMPVCWKAQREVLEFA